MDRTEPITQRNEKHTQYKNLIKELKTLDEARSDLQKYLDTDKGIHKKNELE